MPHVFGNSWLVVIYAYQAAIGRVVAQQQTRQALGSGREPCDGKGGLGRRRGYNARLLRGSNDGCHIDLQQLLYRLLLGLCCLFGRHTHDYLLVLARPCCVFQRVDFHRNHGRRACVNTRQWPRAIVCDGNASDATSGDCWRCHRRRRRCCCCRGCR